jgi:hypothetical protein
MSVRAASEGKSDDSKDSFYEVLSRLLIIILSAM